MGVAIYVVDAFTSEPFKGNPASVCLANRPLYKSEMQAIAAEMRHSETAFPVEIGPKRYGLRWFTPSVEVDLCGHATLATAHVLWESKRARERITFETRSGELTAEQSGPSVVLDFPADFPQSNEISNEATRAIGMDALFYGSGSQFWIAELENEESVRKFQPDFDAIAALSKLGLIVTARSDEPTCDFVSRVFAPQAGVLEDPVTGSAHCLLAPYWSAKLEKAKMIGHQVSERGGIVDVEMNGSRVNLIGSAVTTLVGELFL